MTRLKLGINKKCPVCSSLFYVKRSDTNRLKTCSHKCRSIFMLGHKPFHWNGGKTKHKGYVLVLCKKHPRANKDGYVPEHVLVAELKLGRFLKKTEVVHHINGIRDDNQEKNIIVLKNQAKHFRSHRVWKFRKNIK